MESYSLEFVALAEIGDADGQIGERTVFDDLCEMFLIDPLDNLERLHGDSFILHLCCSCKYSKHCSPSRSKVLNSSLNHLMKALKNHVSSVRMIVVDHGVLERFEEVFLELEVCQLLLFEETHRELSKRVEGEERHFCIRVTGDLRRGNANVSRTFGRD